MAEPTPLAPGSRVPHFVVARLDGARVRYADIWQRWHLVFASLPDDDPDAAVYALALGRQMEVFLGALDTVIIVTSDRLPGLPSPGIIVADRWGEIVECAGPSRVRDLPAPEALAVTLQAIDHACPECEGEAR